MTFQCRATLVLSNGKREDGLATSVGAGNTSPNVTWFSDDQKAQQELQARQRAAQAIADQKAAEEAARTATTPIEPKAVLVEDTPKFRELVYSAARIERQNDYKCDTVSAARLMITARGFVLTCNNFAYDLQDKGGHWTIMVE